MFSTTFKLPYNWLKYNKSIRPKMTKVTQVIDINTLPKNQY